MQEKEPQYVNSIIRATSILELYEKLNVQYLGIAEISKELGIQKTTVFNIVKTLAERNGIRMPEPELLAEANKWELSHGGLSGRSAQQFVDYLQGMQPEN